MKKALNVFGLGTATAVAFAAGVTVSSLEASNDMELPKSTLINKTSCTSGSTGHKDEIFVAAGSFTMGADDERLEERHAHRVALSGFWIDPYEVTNAQFAEFVAATGYVTTAEAGLGEKGAGIFPETLTRPGGMVFSPPQSNVTDLSDVSKWWRWIEGANWRQPEGPGSSIEGREHHPVVQVSIEDAYAYAQWAERSLPTEAQWEFAARGGRDGAKYAWGDTYTETDTTKANTWQGAFPHADAKLDGVHGTAPVGCYEPNDYALYDMAGNVWELVLNWWMPGHPSEMQVDPKGPSLRDALPYGSGLGPQATVKGGSWLCSPVYCARYRPSGRQPQELSLSTNHIGFRTVRTE